MMKKYLYSLLIVSAVSGIAPAMAADCTAVGQEVAIEQGGKLSKSTPTVENDREVCVVVVLVPGRDGEKPSRVEVAVPAR